MKKLLIFMTMLLMTTSCYASISRPCGAALEWWLRSQGQFMGAKINTQENNDGTYSITNWKCDVIQPSDSEVEAIIDDYERKPKNKTLEERVSALEEKVK